MKRHNRAIATAKGVIYCELLLLCIGGLLVIRAILGSARDHRNLRPNKVDYS
jgi:hypothetical protein